MKCIICGGSTEAYFTKDFLGRHGLGRVEYVRCGACGFVQSKTHLEMSDGEWGALNRAYHSYHGSQTNADDHRWVDRLQLQADVIAQAAEAGLLPRSAPWVDHGCGDGKLSALLEARGLPTLKYEAYPPAGAQGYLTAAEFAARKYDLVISTSVFEHVRSLASLDEIAERVSASGVLAVHTMVCETVPRDASWFYLIAVHCALFSNESMRRLFMRWGYVASLYQLESRLWFWFKHDSPALAEFARRSQAGGTVFHYKAGFMDYWK